VTTAAPAGSAAAVAHSPLAARDPLAAIAAYWVISGLWPIVHLRSFMAVTGRKHEGWLVQTFGLFIAATGAGLWPRDRGSRPAQERMAVAGALSLAAADVFFVMRRRISPTYLADALAEIGLVAWLGSQRATQEAR
jgi:hypothetical protein